MENKDLELKANENTKKPDVFTIVMLLLIVSIIVVAAVIIVNSTIELTDTYNDTMTKISIIEKTSSGIISDKEIVNGKVSSSGGLIYANGQPGYFLGGNETYIPTIYRIHITFEYEYDDTMFEGTKYYDVSEDIYLSYDVGDFFDSQNLKQ